jgi:hypothetical protein
MPPSWFYTDVLAGWQSKKGPPPATTQQMYSMAAYTSYLTVGDLTGTQTNNYLSVDSVMQAALGLWSSTQELRVSDGALFWTDPDIPNSNAVGYGNVTQNANVMVAQLTIPTGSVHVAVVNLQGRVVGGNATHLIPDYHVQGLHFTIGSTGSVDEYTCTCQAGFANGVCGYGFIPQYQNQCNLHASANCDVDVNECASNPCRANTAACPSPTGCRCTESSTNSSMAADSYACISL